MGTGFDAAQGRPSGDEEEQVQIPRQHRVRIQHARGLRRRHRGQKVRSILQRSARLIAALCLVSAATTAEEAWKPMFDGVSLKGWKETPFSGKGKVSVADGAIVL